MNKEKNIEITKMIELEKWLKDNQYRELSLSECLQILSEMTEEERNYLIFAKMIPLEEIEESLEYYDSHRFPVQIDELAFVNNLTRKYKTNRPTIIKRIRQVRMIKQVKNTRIKTKNRKK